MSGLLYIIFFIACIGTMISIFHFVSTQSINQLGESTFHHFILLLLVYLTVIISFSVMYFSLELIGFNVLYRGGEFIELTTWQFIEEIIYFSAVTLFSVGYGDVVPIGIGRLIAILEALFGYLLPTAFVISVFRKMNTNFP